VPEETANEATITHANENATEHATRHHLKKRMRHKRAPVLPKPMNFSKVDERKLKGNRQAKRQENMRYLLNLAQEANVDLDSEVSYNDFVQPQMSAFAKLMLENARLQIWIDFISRSGQEQDEIIEYASKLNDIIKKKNKHKRRNTDVILQDFEIFCEEKYQIRKESTDSNGFCVVESVTDASDATFRDIKMRKSNSQFDRIDKNIKDVLKRQVDFHKLVDYEDKIVSTFSVSPDSVYISQLPSSFDRMLIHGICQYFDLHSKSFEKDGLRHTQVENFRKIFYVPSHLLSEYVQLKFDEAQDLSCTV